MLVYGGGGHAKVVISAARSAGIEVRGVLDDDPECRPVLGLPVLGAYDAQQHAAEPMVIAVGDNGVRCRLASAVANSFATVVHATALVDATASVGRGSVVLHGAIIQADASIGEHGIVNTGATVDHDCELGPFCHIAPGATLCGGVRVGAHVLIGANATVLPGITIGDGAVIGAGAVVHREVPSGVTAVGNPCRWT